ncbi:MAG TPA: DUF1549 domain-containing protein [Thermoanaerobaculia bacterium]|nr:DUF1549 domain-containing protein [Thermoanaerobaculia bacterium]
MRSRRLPTLSLVLCALTAAALATAPESGDGPADCSFNPEALHSPREVWLRVSRQAEQVAPSSGRRRAVGEPPQTIVSKNFIDDEVFGKMKAGGIRWTLPATDEEFLRRVSLDLTGQIPTAERVKQFLADPRGDKREGVIDELLASEEFADRWTLWFGDLVQNVVVAANINMGPQGRNAYYLFIRDSFRSGKPYDQLVRELITGSGGQNTSGPANYWVRQIQTNGPIHDTWDNLSADTGEKFLGLPLNCVSCHGGIGHLEQVNTGLVYRTREDFWKNAAFFATTYHRPQRDPATNRVEWFIEPSAGARRVPNGYVLNTTSGNKTARQPMPGQPSLIEPAFFLSAEKPAAGEDPRQAYARILTAHPQFARATVNYVWKEIFGIAIVEPADSFDLLRQDPATLPPGATLQPTHPQLLTGLAEHFSGSGFDLRSLLRTIVVSNAYQLSAIYTPGEWNELWTPYYARRYPRRMLAESVIDAVARATGVAPPRFNVGGLQLQRAMQLPDPTVPRGAFGQFLNAFGRGDRDTTPRSSEGSIVQALGLLNDAFVTTRVRAANNSTVQRVLAATQDAGTIADELYLATLSRRPSAEERAAAVAHLAGGDLTQKTEDLQYALLNRLEFLYY